ncbi:hypothetical protein D210916BOD24_24960 [Alteromonas sp. D210916BOD_24]|uniref:glycosyltransferase family 2 protein n=1 Tax=Alteromonas sp. D210916BOD_24 TaxID=3157618 RepID=UPI00399D2D73
MNTFSISVVIPLYNKAKHIERAIQSILEQHIKVEEIIVVDDGSTDGSADVVRAMNVENLTLIEQMNQGVSVARNNGVQAAKGEYVAFLDADDKWLPFFTFEIQKLSVRFPDLQAYATRYQCIVDENQPADAKIILNSVSPEGYALDNYFDIASKGDLPFMVSSFVLKKSYFETLGGFPVNEPMGEDQDLFVKAALDAPIAYSPNIHLHYHCDSMNRAMERVIPSQICPFATRLYQRLLTESHPEAVVKSAQKYCATHGLFIAKQNIQRGNISVALSILNSPMCKHRYVKYSVFQAIASLLSVKGSARQMFRFPKKEFQS